jgi:hypothetical protein
MSAVRVRLAVLGALAASTTFAACLSQTAGPTPGGDDAGFAFDGPGLPDVNEGDSAPPPASPDAGTDATIEDAGQDTTIAVEGGPDTSAPDAGSDATVEDAGTDTSVAEAGSDTFAPDASAPDAAVEDAGPDVSIVDTGAPDAGPPDAAPVDAGPPDAIATIATGQHTPWWIVVDGINAYWTNFASGDIVQMALDGGAPTILTNVGSNNANGMAVSATTIYWTNFTANTVESIPIGGGSVKTIASGEYSPQFMTVDQNNVYWAYNGKFVGSGGVVAAPLDGGPAVQLVTSDLPLAVTVQGDTLAYTNWTGAGSINTVLVDGGSPQTLIPNLALPEDITQQAGRYYFAANTDGGTRSLWAASVAGPPVTLLYLSNNVSRLAVDGKYVYWTENAAGNVFALPLDADGGAAPIPIATSQSQPVAVTVVGGYVYWTNEGDGTVRRAPAPQ